MCLFQKSKAVHICVLVSALIATTSAPVILASKDAVYTRGDCITKFSVKWENSEPLNAIHAEVRTWMASEEFSHTGIPVAGIAYGTKEDPVYFVQYYDGCERRLQYTIRLVDAWNAISPIDHYNVSSDRILPSPDTIDVSGRRWLD